MLLATKQIKEKCSHYKNLYIGAITFLIRQTCIVSASVSLLRFSSQVNLSSLPTPRLQVLLNFRHCSLSTFMLVSPPLVSSWNGYISDQTSLLTRFFQKLSLLEHVCEVSVVFFFCLSLPLEQPLPQPVDLPQSHQPGSGIRLGVVELQLHSAGNLRGTKF